MPSPRAVAAILAVLFIAPAAASAQSRSFTFDDLAKIRSVSDPQRSPDGKWVAYTVGTSDTEKDKHNRDLWMVSWDGKEQVQLTSSKDNESKPRWSPDGKYLAFLTSRGDEDEKKKGAQVWLLNRSGGEALQLTDIKGGVNDFAWSPDSARLVLVVERRRPERRAREEGRLEAQDHAADRDRSLCVQDRRRVISTTCETTCTCSTWRRRRRRADNRRLSTSGSRPGRPTARRSRSSASAGRIPIARTTPTCGSWTRSPARRRSSSRRSPGRMKGGRRGAPTASGSPTCRATTSATTPTT